MLFRSLLLVAVCMLINSCTRHAYHKTNKYYKKQAKGLAKDLQKQDLFLVTEAGTPPYWVGTTNFSLRKPNFVVLHHTAQNSCDQTLRTFTLTRTKVSSHYVVCKDGLVHQMLHDNLRAHHGGISKWGGQTDLNSSSIGIEIDNNGFEPFSERQINSLLTLLDTLKTRHGIPTANFIGHSDIAPVRKVDPNIHFPWKRLADRGFGIWYGDTTNIVVPTDFNYIHALRIVGYDVKDTTATKLAFKRRFVQDTSRVITESDKKILWSLLQKSL